MKKGLKEKIVEKAAELGLDTRNNYSGRGMFGRTCLGVVGSMQDLDTLLSEVKGSAKGLRKDSMGLDYIYYWPDIEGFGIGGDVILPNTREVSDTQDNPGDIEKMEKNTVTVHTYYHEHDVYEIPRAEWERELAEHGGDKDETLQCFIVHGTDPVNGDTTEFYVEVEE